MHPDAKDAFQWYPNKFVKAKDKTKSTDHFDVKNKNLKSNNPSTVTSNRICSENEVPDSEKELKDQIFAPPYSDCLAKNLKILDVSNLLKNSIPSKFMNIYFYLNQIIFTLLGNSPVL